MSSALSAQSVSGDIKDARDVSKGYGYPSALDFVEKLNTLGRHLNRSADRRASISDGSDVIQLDGDVNALPLGAIRDRDRE